MCEEEIILKLEYLCDDIVKEFCFDIMEEIGDVMLDNVFSVKELYLSFRDVIFE